MTNQLTKEVLSLPNIVNRPSPTKAMNEMKAMNDKVCILSHVSPPDYPCQPVALTVPISTYICTYVHISQRIALLISNELYDCFEKLTTPARDAECIEKKLK